jgi:hypothetical protein
MWGARHRALSLEMIEQFAKENFILTKAVCWPNSLSEANITGVQSKPDPF